MQIGETLARIFTAEKKQFVFNGKLLSMSQIFAENGLLPGLVKRADEMVVFCLGYGMGADFVEDQNSLLGQRVQFDTMTPDSLRLLFIYEVIMDIAEVAYDGDGNIILDEVIYY